MKRIILAMFAFSISTPLHAQDRNSAKSPDGLYTASILPNGKGDENGTGSQALVLYSSELGGQRRLLVSKYDEDYSKNLTGLSNPIFSLDGGYVYFSSADASPNSAYVHQFDLRMNTIRTVCSGWGLRVMRSGPYRGYLLVEIHRYYAPPRMGSYDPIYLVKPSGEKVIMIPGSDVDGDLAIDPWLAKMSWRAW